MPPPSICAILMLAVLGCYFLIDILMPTLPADAMLLLSNPHGLKAIFVKSPPTLQLPTPPTNPQAPLMQPHSPTHTPTHTSTLTLDICCFGREAVSPPLPNCSDSGCHTLPTFPLPKDGLPAPHPSSPYSQQGPSADSMARLLSPTPGFPPHPRPTPDGAVSPVAGCLTVAHQPQPQPQPQSQPQKHGGRHHQQPHHPPVDPFTGMFTELCFDGESGGCTGEVRIWRAVCPPFPKEVAHEGGLEAEIHALGPDSFRVRWEGPEVVMVAMRHIGGCRYEGSFAFSLPGEYDLQAFTMFANFHGHADPPYARPVYMPNVLVPSDRQKVHCVRPLHPWQAPSMLPRCDTLQAPGRWVRTTSGGVEAERVITGWPTTWLKAGVVFAHHWGDGMQWQPYSCHYTDHSQDDLVHALSGMRIAFVGDSQTRSMFYPVVNAIHQNKVLGNPKIADHEPNHAGWVEFTARGNITMRYYIDNFLSDSKNLYSLAWHSLIRSSTHDWDLLITGMGNWAVCGNLPRQGVGLWSFHRYRLEINRIAKQLQAYTQRTGTRVIWHNQPDFPWEMDPYRNGARLSLFNRYATDRMVSGGIEVFDAFNVSTGMLHTAVGGSPGHFNDFHVRENWARILLSYLVDHPRPMNNNTAM